MADTRLTMAVNLANGAPTQYENYDFNSYARHGNKIYAANEDGIYTLDDANDDNGTDIAAFFETPTTDFGIQSQKNFDRAYLGYSAGGTLTLTLTPDEITDNAVAYTLSQAQADSHEDYIDLGAFKFGRYWKVRIDNSAGCDFRFDLLSLVYPATGKPLPVVKGVRGINQRTHPTRIKYDPETGIVDLAACVNCYIDDSLAIARRRGFTLRQSGSFHSLYSDGANLFVMKNRGTDAALYQVGSNYGITGMAAGFVPNAKMSYQTTAGTMYYANGYDKAKLTGNVGASWVGNAVPATEPQARNYYVSTDPPVANIVRQFGGYMLLAVGPFLYWSMDRAYSWYRLSRDRRVFASPITMIEPLNDGVWVSDGQATYWLAGKDPNAWPKDCVMGHAAIKGTSVVTEGSRILEGEVSGRCVLWTSPQGICVGHGQGLTRNLTEKTLNFPSASSGAAVVNDRWNDAPGMPIQYIVSLEP